MHRLVAALVAAASCVPVAQAQEAGFESRRNSEPPLTLEEAVTQAAWAYRELTEAGVNVIRIGLQPDEELCAPGNILAGPFHPAMGELVKSRVLRIEVTSQLEKLADCGAVDIICQ